MASSSRSKRITEKSMHGRRTRFTRVIDSAEGPLGRRPWVLLSWIQYKGLLVFMNQSCNSNDCCCANDCSPDQLDGLFRG